MENQNNHRRIPALGIVVDSVSVPRAIEISQKFFYNDYFNFVLFAGSWLALESQTSDEIRKFISEADLILPGDHNIEKVAEQESEESFQALYLDGLLSALAQMEGHVCVLCETEQIEEDIVNNILEDYPGLTVECVLYEQDDEEALEALVNKINGYFPDLVLPAQRLNQILCRGDQPRLVFPDKLIASGGIEIIVPSRKSEDLPIVRKCDIGRYQ